MNIRGKRSLWLTPQRVGGWCVAVLAAAGVARAQTAPPASDWSHLPAGTVAAVVAYPRALLQTPEMEMMPREIFSAATLQQIGIDVTEVEQLTVLAAMPPQSPPLPGAIVRFAKPTTIPPQLAQRGKEVQVGSAKGLQLDLQGMPLVVVMADDRTALVGPPPLIQQMQQAGEGPIRGLLSRAPANPLMISAVVHLPPLRPMIQGGLQQAPPLPPPLEGLKSLPQDIESLQLLVHISHGIQLKLAGNDEAAAKRAHGTVAQAIGFGKQMLLAQAQNTQNSEDPVERASGQYLTRISGLIEKQVTPRLLGRELELRVEANYGAAGIVTALLLPAVQAAREAARRTSSANSLKQLALAMHIHHDAHGQFPVRASRDASGKPLLSWRVHLLPYLEQQALYEQFHFDEPWDSEHNRKLIPLMPLAYFNPNQTTPREAGKTVYLAADGKGTLLDGAQKGTKMADVLDGTSNTIMFVEADENVAVIWTKPDDLPYDPAQPLRGLGHLRNNGFQAALCDGSVRFIANSVSLDVLRALFTRAGGETIPGF